MLKPGISGDCFGLNPLQRAPPGKALISMHSFELKTSFFFLWMLATNLAVTRQIEIYTSHEFFALSINGSKRVSEYG